MPQLSRFSGAKVWSSTSLSVVTNTATDLTYDTVLHDTDGYFSKANPGRLTCPFDGFYRVCTQHDWQASATANMRRAYIYRNGTTEAVAAIGLNGGDSNNKVADAPLVSSPIYCKAGDFFQVQVLQDTGGNLTLNASQNVSPTFSIEYLGTL